MPDYHVTPEPTFEHLTILLRWWTGNGERLIEASDQRFETLRVFVAEMQDAFLRAECCQRDVLRAAKKRVAKTGACIALEPECCVSGVLRSEIAQIMADAAAANAEVWSHLERRLGQCCLADRRKPDPPDNRQRADGSPDFRADVSPLLSGKRDGRARFSTWNDVARRSCMQRIT